MAYTDGNIVIGTSVDMYGMNTGLKKIENSARKLSYTLSTVLGLAGGFTFGGITKAALDAASNLQEVQNVIDVSFGEMSWKAENFAKTCIDSFGMSELAAKKTAGSFMAMGRAMDLNLEEASNMAIKLTALTGDFASFYNISQDYARVALSAVYTGETETLKRYGIVLTEANLQQFAYTKGIETSIKKMSARDKLLLRYMYILQATSQVEGDFVRTQNTWANQMRVLQERWRQFLITVGNGLITILTPLLRMLNALLSATIRFANTIGRVLAKLFGIKWQDLSGQLTDVGDAGADAGDGLGDIGDGADKAGKALDKTGKKAKKVLAPFDDLNVLLKNEDESLDSAADALDGFADDIGASDYLGDLVKDSTDVNDIKDPIISTLFDLGRWLNQKLQEILDSIDWDKIRRKARDIGHELANFFNGLISPDLFSKLGYTVAQGLNTILELLDGFAERFNWRNLGKSIAAGINSFFETFDFKLLAATINHWAHGILDAILQILHDVDWEMIGRQLGTLLSNIDWIGILKKVAKAIFEAFSAITQILVGMLKEAPIETVLLGGIAGLVTALKFIPKLKQFGKVLLLLSDAFHGVSGSVAELGAMSPALGTLGSAINAFRLSSMAAFGEFNAGLALGATKMQAFGGSAITFFNTFSSQVSACVKILGTAVVGVTEFFLVMHSFKDIVLDIVSVDNAFNDLVKSVGVLVAAVAGAGVALSLLLGFPTGIIAAGVIALVGAIAGFAAAAKSVFEDQVAESFQVMLENADEATHTLGDYVDRFRDQAETALSGFDEIAEAATSFETAQKSVQDTIDVLGRLHLAIASERELTEEEINKLNSAFDGLQEQVSKMISAYYDSMIAKAYADYQYLSSTGRVTEQVKKQYADMIQGYYEAKESAIQNGNAIVENTQSAMKKLVEVEQDEGASEQELADARKAYYDSFDSVAKLTGEYGVIVDELTQKVDGSVASMDKFKGALDFTTTTPENMLDFSSQVASALDSISEAYSNTYDELYDEWAKEEDKSSEHAKNIELRMEDLKKAYKENLDGIQKDLIKITPELTKAAEEAWHAMDPNKRALLELQGMTEAEFVKKTVTENLADLYGENLNTALKQSYGKIGAESSVVAEETSGKILDSFFNRFSNYGSFLNDFSSYTADTLNEAIGEVPGMIDESAVEDIGGNIKEGVKKGIVDYYIDWQATCWEFIFSPIYFAVTRLFGIASPSTVMAEIGGYIIEGLFKGITDMFNYGISFIESLMDTLKSDIEEALTINPSVTENINQTIENAKLKFESFKTFVENNVISPMKQKWIEFKTSMETSVITPFEKAWEKAFNAIKTFAKSLLSSIISIMNQVITSVETAINSILDGVKRAGGILGIFAKLAGGSLSLGGMSHVKLPRIPALAKGAVIPPNAPFMAMLGDQKQGTNVEAPLDTIKQALREVLGNSDAAASGSVSLNLQVDGQTFARLFVPYSLAELQRRGYNVDVLEAR